MHRPDLTPTPIPVRIEFRRPETPRDPNALGETLSRLLRIDVGVTGGTGAPAFAVVANDPGAGEPRHGRRRISEIGTIRLARDDARIRSIQSNHDVLKIKGQRHKALKTFMICG